jgi:hypothetical protein
MKPLNNKQRELLQAILDGKEIEVLGQAQDSMDARAPGGEWGPTWLTDAGRLVQLVTNYPCDYRVKPPHPEQASFDTWWDSIEDHEGYDKETAWMVWTARAALGVTASGGGK